MYIRGVILEVSIYMIHCRDFILFPGVSEKGFIIRGCVRGVHEWVSAAVFFISEGELILVPWGNWTSSSSSECGGGE